LIHPQFPHLRKDDTVNLIYDAWLPVRKSDGSRQCIRPCDLVDIETTDVDVPRADLAVAARTFLIGLVTTAGLAETESDWQRFYDNPPTADDIIAALSRFAPAFELLGDGPRFCQHQAVVEDGDRQRIASIFIDGSSEESDERNHDVMRDVVGLSPSTAALALYALQQFAPSGGRGHRQSMRRGSPMSTLISGGTTLWHNVWVNVETREQLTARTPEVWHPPPDIGDVFPWMARVRTSETGLETTTSDAHPLQVYWQMPRLLWLDAGPARHERCGLTGASNSIIVRGYYRRQLGVQYAADWRHPHVPYVREPKGVVPAKASVRASHIGDWLGVVYRDQNGDRQPAAVVTTATTHRAWAHSDVSLRVDVFGFHMSGRKVLGAISHVMPIITIDPLAADDLRAAVEAYVLAIEHVAEFLEKTAWKALAGPGTKDAEKRTANAVASSVKTAFLMAMERHVERAIRAAAAAIQAGSFDPLSNARALHFDIRREVEAAFDVRIPTDTWVRGLERRISQRWELSQVLAGKKKAGAEFFARLQLPTPVTKEEAKNAA
jgi:CRISPR system Cascade subunit CasA